MAKATTQRFDELILQVETSTPGTFTKICGLVDVTITRTAAIATAEVPDCDDESLPHHIEKEVTSLDVSVSGTGVWAQQSWGLMSDWFYSAATKNVRVSNAKASVGDIEIESGPALLETLTNTRTKGQKVSAEISLQFVGIPSRTDQT
jgi:hypothetical protein